MGLTLLIAGADAVTVEEVKDHCRISQGVEDAQLSKWLKAAQRIAESVTGRALTIQTWTLKLDAFPAVNDGEIRLPKGPNWAVTSITYIDVNGVSQTLATANYEIDASKGRLRPTATGTGWPSTDDVYNAVTVTFTCGFGAAASVPETIKSAIFLIVADWYENRERAEDLSPGAKALLMAEWDGVYLPAHW